MEDLCEDCDGPAGQCACTRAGITVAHGLGMVVRPVVGGHDCGTFTYEATPTPKLSPALRKLGKALRSERMKAGVALGEMADLLGCKVSALSALERGIQYEACANQTGEPLVDGQEIAAFIRGWANRNSTEVGAICHDVQEDVALPYETFIYNLCILAGVKLVTDEEED